MKCSKCDKGCVIPDYCKEHFIEYFEKKVEDTIAEFNMLDKKDKIAVGISGGKDSMSLLYILKKLGYNVTGISVDEGIKGYRDPNFEFVKEFCEKYKIKVDTYSFKDVFGKNLDEMKTATVGGMPCTTCGTFRRYILNKGSKGFNKIAVGHNMDDEAQAVMMNLFKAQVQIMKRQGPITTEREGFTQRIKPLYYLKEKEVATYAFVQGFLDKFEECPNARLAYRINLRDLLNEYESKKPGTKENIVRKFLAWKDTQDLTEFTSVLNKCKECGEPASKEVCKACEIVKKI